MTYPLIGNYGRVRYDDQSERPWLRGLIVANATAAVLDDARQLATMLREAGIPAIAGVDTRALARHLRSSGSLRAIVTAPGQTDPRGGARAGPQRAPLGGPGLRGRGLARGRARRRRPLRGRPAGRDPRLRPEDEHRAQPSPARGAGADPASHRHGGGGAGPGRGRRRLLAGSRRPGPAATAPWPWPAQVDRRRPPAAGHLPGPPDHRPGRRREHAHACPSATTPRTTR